MTRRHRASLPLWCVAILLLSVPPSWGQQELRSGKKGATDPAPVTSTSIDANHQALDVNVAGGSLGNVTIENTDGAITDGANNTIKATVKDYTNSNPLAVELVDTNGDPASIGGGTEYAQGTANTSTDVLKMMGCVRVDTPAVASGVIDGDRARCIVDSTGRLWVHVGVIDGTVAATQSGTWNIGTLTSITNPVAVTGTFWQATQPVSGTVAATQSGTWTVQPGNTANTTPWLATIAQGGNSATVNGSGQLAVNCANCSGSGVSQQDNTGFTPGTTNFVPMGGEVDDTGTTAVTENNAGVARITAQRAVHMNLRNNSGTEIGTSGNPVRTDPTGSTTQPVSGTVSISGTVTVSDGAGALNVICDSGCSGGTQYAEDSIHASGDTVTMAGVVRSDAAGALAADGDRTVLQVDANGYLKVINVNPNLAADNSTLSTAKVPVLPGTVSTAAPTWTTGNQSALSLQTDGSVRAAVTNSVTIGTFPDNEPFNVAQINGATTQVASNGLNTTGSGLLAQALVGQCDDTAPTALTENQFGHARINCTTHHQIVEVGPALPTGTNSIGQVTANAGTNLNTSALLTTTAHDNAFGTAGSADAQVRSVQGIASMTPLLVQPQAIATGGADGLSYISVGTTEDEHPVKTSAGTLYSITATNTNAAVRYLKCEADTAANTVPGTDTPELRIAIPGATAGAGITTNFGPSGWAFPNALTCWLVTGAADSDVAEVAANEIMLFYTYK